MSSPRRNIQDRKRRRARERRWWLDHLEVQEFRELFEEVIREGIMRAIARYEAMTPEERFQHHLQSLEAMR